jgi:predicted transposase YdaD
MNVNKKYKDSVFSFLFSEPEVLRELYGAIEGISIKPDVQIVITTLSEVLFKEQINDISFTIDNKLVILIEHQSTINPNMPVRLLTYLGRVYEKILEAENIYSEKALTIPRPEFIILYNGSDLCPDVQTLRLSDLFAPLEDLKPETIPAMDITVTVYNINQGHNEGMVRRCETLREYSAFIEKIREYRDGQKMPLDEAMVKAIAYCIDHTILSDFLREHGAEVINMLLTEWNIDDAKKVWQKEALEEGEKKGREETLNEVLELLEQGYRADQIKAKLSSKPDDI